MGRTRKLPKNNDTTSKEAIEKEKAVQEMLDSVMVYDVSSSSEQAAKKSKLSTLSEEPGAQIFGAPINELEDFYQFDNKIQHDLELATNLRELMSFKTRTKGLYEAIGGVLTALMAHELQLLFNGCEKPNKVVAKLNFSATQIYKKLNDHLLKQFTNENQNSILSKTSRWLAAAKGRQNPTP